MVKIVTKAAAVISLFALTMTVAISHEPLNDQHERRFSADTGWNEAVSFAVASPEEQLDVIVQVCSGCHTLDYLSEGPARSKDQWREVVVDMMGRGAQIFPDEVDDIALYLENLYGNDKET